jgi:drug/metabolite transporter (DMT)-like permease
MPPTPNPHHGLGTLMGLVAILLWSSTVAVARSMTEQIGGLPGAAATYTWAGVILCTPLLFRRGALARMRTLPPRYLLVCGSLFVVNLAVLFIGIGLARNREQVLAVGLLNYLWPAITLLLSIILLPNRADLRLLVPGILLALIGEVLAMTTGSAVSLDALLHNLYANPLPYALGLVSALTWGFYSTLTRRWVGGGSGAIEVFMLASGLLIIAACVATGQAPTWTPRAAIEVAALGISSALAYSSWDFAMRRGRVSTVAACSYLTPLLSLLISCLYLRIVPTPGVWLGCALLIAGSILSWRSITHHAG